MSWQDQEDRDEGATGSPPSQRPYPPQVQDQLAQMGELGLSASQYESLRVRRMATGLRVRTNKPLSRSPIHLDLQLVRAGEELSARVRRLFRSAPD